MSDAKRAATIETLARLETAYGVVRFEPCLDPLEELVACILSQHTADARSVPAFHRLRGAYPEWHALAEASVEEIAAEIRDAGLSNQKAKSIRAALRAICDRYGTYTLEPLKELEDIEAKAILESLPGVGPKTASIVLCFAMGRPVVPVDTHVFRVSWRLGLIPRELGEARAHDALLRIVAPADCLRFHLLLIEHGRAVCHARKPACGLCAVRDLCAHGSAA